MGLVGLVSGVGFGILLSLTERRKSIGDLSLSRTALWGFVGAAALPLLTGMQDVLVFVTGPLGAVFAAASVAIARSAALREAKQPEPLSEHQIDR
jgi:ABC-type lipoprotein release transport system permease subunit